MGHIFKLISSIKRTIISGILKESLKYNQEHFLMYTIVSHTLV